VENVGALAFRGLERVLADLAAIGFDAEWQIVSARAVGAPHKRERLWLVAYPECAGLEGHGRPDEAGSLNPRWAAAYPSPSDSGAAWDYPYAEFLRVDDGLPARLDRIRALGNSIVPQISEMIGRAILAAEVGRAAALAAEKG
jgi:DNA (cytosine-5)-methyltransferase 1